MIEEVVLAIGGCRDYDSVEHFNKELAGYIEYLEDLGLKVVEIRIGDAPGIDSMALDYAIANNISWKVEFADWDRDKRAAGMIRNRYVISPATHFLAFWDGKSLGTKGALELASQMKKSIVRKRIECTENRYYSEKMKQLRNEWKANQSKE